MARTTLLLASALALCPLPALADFDWGGGCQGGSGTFEQAIERQAVVTVGDIPAGLEGVSITLRSDDDIDIQLFDKASGAAIVKWPDGILNGAGPQSTDYQGMTIEWSGYNGTDGMPGHESIRVLGTTTLDLEMRVFGYAAGVATVDYSWTAESGGSGTFEQAIERQQVVTVGEIPAGLEGVSISLRSADDIDIQLFDKDTGTAIVKWPDGILRGAGVGTTVYEGMTVEWSGYNGVNGEPGHEYITVQGATTRDLVMKVFGYSAGQATVEYAWDGCACSGSGTFEQPVAERAVLTVGDIPAGLEGVSISLTSAEDVDIQLFDAANGVAIVGWPDGILNGAGLQTTSYEGMTVEWSGYNGVDGERGHEYIAIEGATTRDLVMKVYGYRPGLATVDYAWTGSLACGGGAQPAAARLAAEPAAEPEEARADGGRGRGRPQECRRRPDMPESSPERVPCPAAERGRRAPNQRDRGRGDRGGPRARR